MQQRLREELTAEVRALPTPKQIAFLCCCCERLAPNYRAYCKDEGVGDPDLLDYSLDLLWAVVRGKKVATETVNSLLRAIEAAPCDEDRRSSFLALAQDALSAVMFTSEFVLDNSAARISHVMRWCDEAVSEWIAMTSRLDPNDVGGEMEETPEASVENLQKAQERYLQWVFEHPMSREEGCCKMDHLDELRRMNTSSSLGWHSLRERAKKVGIQPLVRGIGPVR